MRRSSNSPAAATTDGGDDVARFQPALDEIFGQHRDDGCSRRQNYKAIGRIFFAELIRQSAQGVDIGIGDFDSQDIDFFYDLYVGKLNIERRKSLLGTKPGNLFLRFCEFFLQNINFGWDFFHAGFQ